MDDAQRERLRSIGTISKRTRDIVREGRDADGNRTRAVTDQLGNTVTEHNNARDQVDVNIQAPHVRVSTETQEMR